MDGVPVFAAMSGASMISSGSVKMRVIAAGAFLIVGLALFGCTTDHIKLPELADTSIPLPDGGQLIVTTDRDVAIDGVRRQVVDRVWSNFCHLSATYNCSPKSTYNIQIGGQPLSNCWATARGPVTQTDGVKKGALIGLAVDVRCFPQKEGIGLIFWPCPPYFYKLDDVPVVAICDNPPESLRTVPVPVTTFNGSERTLK